MVVFLCFGSYILQSSLIQDRNKFKCTDEDAIEKSLEIANRRRKIFGNREQKKKQRSANAVVA